MPLTPLLTLEQVHAYLDPKGHYTLKQFRKNFIYRKQIDHIRVGNDIMVREAAVDRYLNKRTKKGLR